MLKSGKTEVNAFAPLHGGILRPPTLQEKRSLLRGPQHTQSTLSYATLVGTASSRDKGGSRVLMRYFRCNGRPSKSKAAFLK